jgi:hypothetical protein
MSLGTVSGLSGSDYIPPYTASMAAQAAAATQTAAGMQAGATTQAGAAMDTPGGATTALFPAKSGQPLLLVPAEPLSPAVLAELVGRQMLPNGPTVND